MSGVLRNGISGGLALIGLSLLTACNTASNQTVTEDTLDLDQQVQQNVPEDRSGDLRAFCPKTIIRDGTEVYRTFVGNVKSTDPGALNSLEYQATITEVARECNYSPTNLNMRVGVKGRVINGPTGATGSFTAPVRVAVVEAPNNVLYSKLHQMPVNIPEGGSNARFSFVDGEIFLPVPERPNLIVYVGFDEGPPEQAQLQQ